MSEINNRVNCKKCGDQVSGDYCSSCGQPKHFMRINGKYIISEIVNVLNFDKGILFTMKELLIRPGTSIRNFILEDRNRLVKPVVFIILTSLIYTLMNQFLGFEDGYVNYSFEDDSAISNIFGWITGNYGYSNILMAFFIALWIKLFFRKYDYNFFEVLILLCFLIGMGMLIFALFGLIETMLPLKIIDKGFLIGVLYICWGIAQFFDKKKVGNYFKSLFSYFLGMLSFSILAVLIGLAIDLIK